MSEVKVDKITNRVGTGAPRFPNGITIGGQTVASQYPGVLAGSIVESNGTPTNVSAGTYWFNDSGANKFLAIYYDDNWIGLSGEVVGGAAAPMGGDRGFSMAGTGPSTDDVVEYWDLTTTSNAQTFGNTLTTDINWSAACGNGTRVINHEAYSNISTYDTISYITSATLGNAVDFGNTFHQRVGEAAASNGTYGIFGAGYGATGPAPYSGPAGRLDDIDYVTISTTGNAADWGDVLPTNRSYLACADNSSYVLFAGGLCDAGGGSPYSSSSNVAGEIYKLSTTVGSGGTLIGDLSDDRGILKGAESPTRALFMGGLIGSSSTASNWCDIIDYMDFASEGNATDFGNLVRGNAYGGACSNDTTAAYFGGYDNISGSTTEVADIRYITMATTGNATDAGDLTRADHRMDGASGLAS